jgi:hypothetical protein
MCTERHSEVPVVAISSGYEVQLLLYSLIHNERNSLRCQQKHNISPSLLHKKAGLQRIMKHRNRHCSILTYVTIERIRRA